MKIIFLLFLSVAVNLGAINKDSSDRGKQIYDSVCFACHGKDLEGAIGHNLKDSIWVYGGTKEQIFNTIKKGFPEKGMVAFGAIYNDQQIEDITNYILSRQEGLRDMEYKIYHNATVETGVKWDSQKPDKQATLKPPHINLNLPEVDQYAIQYKGKLLIPPHLAGNFKLKGLVRQSDGLSLHIDGKEVDLKISSKKRIDQQINLTAGSHDIEFRYIKNFKSTTLHLDLLSGKANIPLSSESFRRSVTSQHIVKANDSFQIIRKRTAILPPGAIIVNHKDMISYAINPEDAAINSIWAGKSLDIGPNIYARGQQPSKLLGKPLFSDYENIYLLIDGEQRKLKYIGYSNKPEPRFFYSYGSNKINISSTMTANHLTISYAISSEGAAKVQLKLPESFKLAIPGGERKGEIFTPENQKSFQIIIPVEEKK